jgi:hypothetical protein
MSDWVDCESCAFINDCHGDNFEILNVDKCPFEKLDLDEELPIGS